MAGRVNNSLLSRFRLVVEVIPHPLHNAPRVRLRAAPHVNSEGVNVDKLWAPWRMEYILSDKSGCFICDAAESDDDRASLVVARGEKAFVLLNRFPYNNGHLLICPYRHLGMIEDLDAAELQELMGFLVEFKCVLDRVTHADGYNVGLNLGEAAGAGLAEHLHMHIVPRWKNDTNFMPLLGETKVIPQHLSELREQLVEARNG
ncbi:HIT domain-containing protein [Planctomycetota bacterium]